MTDIPEADIPLADKAPRFTKEQEEERSKTLCIMKLDYPDMHPYLLRSILDFVLDNETLNKDIIDGKKPDWGLTPKPRDTQDSINKSHALRKAEWEQMEAAESLLPLGLNECGVNA